MELPFAVFTARQGARWISGPTGDHAALEGFRRAVGKMPEFDMGDPPSCGVVNSGDTAVVYRFMCARKADFRGRDAPYLALTYFPRSLAASIDIESLLALIPFAAPLADPPSSISYDGGASAPSALDPRSFPPPGRLATTDGFSSTGALFAIPFDGVLRLSRTEPARSASLAVSYVPPQPSAPFASPSAVPSPQIRPPSPGMPEQSASMPPPFFRRHARRACYAAAAAALLISMLIGWRLQQRSSGSHATAAVSHPQTSDPSAVVPAPVSQTAAAPQPEVAYSVVPPDPFVPWARLVPPLLIQPFQPASSRLERCWLPIDGGTP
jgi:hypothetical protein